MMNVSTLLRELAAHGVELNVDGRSLRVPKWPEQCPKDLHKSFVRNRRAIMSRLALPVFLQMQSSQRYDGSIDSTKRAVHELVEDIICVVLIDDEFIVWLPGLSQQFVRDIEREFARSQAGTWVEKVQIVAGRKLPSIVRQALSAGRTLCAWNSQAIAEPIWCGLNFPGPTRWIDLRNLARAGGWALGFDDLVWNLLQVHPNRHHQSGNCLPPNRRKSLTAITDCWVERIRNEVNHVLSVGDLYDRLREFDEAELLELHNEINSRGIGVNVDAVSFVLGECRKNAERQFAHITEATGGTMTPANLLENEFVRSWLRSRGLEFADLNAETIEWSRNHMRASGLHVHPSVEAVLQARISLARQPIGTLMRAIEAVDDRGRVRNHMMYFANRSGQFSCPRIAIRDLLFASHWKYRWKWGISTEAPPGEDWRSLTTEEWMRYQPGELVSHCFVPGEDHVFAIFDWSGLEIEVLRWLVSDHLQVPYDPEEMAMEFPPPWIEKARRELAQQLHHALSRGQQRGASKWQLSVAPDVIAVRLPSGRSIHYRTVTPFSDDQLLNVDEPNAVRPIDRTSQRKWPDVNSLVFDLVRAVNRDFMTSALVRCAAAGGHIVAHGSDFILVEVAKKSQTATVNTLIAPLVRPPQWAAGVKYEVGCTTCCTLGGGWVETGHNTDDDNSFL